MPLIADNIIVFLFRTFLRMMFRYECQSWSRSSTRIQEAKAVEGTMYPCTQVRYTYTVNGAQHEGKYKRGFWSHDSAKRLASEFTKAHSLTIRVSPNNPERSYLLEEDQLWWQS